MFPYREMKNRFILFIVLACLSSPLAGCGTFLPYSADKEIRSARAVGNLIRVPLTRQSSDYTCGVAVMQSILYFLDEKDDYSEEILAKELKADPSNGTSYRAMADLARSKGYRVDVKTGMALDDVHGYIDLRIPVIVLIQAWAESPVDYSRDWEDGHYAVAVGYDRDAVYFMDPSTLGNYTYLLNQDFLDRWHDEDKGERLNQFGLIITRPDHEPSYEKDRVYRIR